MGTNSPLPAAVNRSGSIELEDVKIRTIAVALTTLKSQLSLICQRPPKGILSVCPSIKTLMS